MEPAAQLCVDFVLERGSLGVEQVREMVTSTKRGSVELPNPTWWPSNILGSFSTTPETTADWPTALASGGAVGVLAFCLSAVRLQACGREALVTVPKS